MCKKGIGLSFVIHHIEMLTEDMVINDIQKGQAGKRKHWRFEAVIKVYMLE